MGKPVTVDSDDLKAVLFSTGAIKAVEGALKQHRDDPLVRMVKGDLEAAHDRLAADWRRAEREDRLKLSDDPIDEECGRALQRFTLPASDDGLPAFRPVIWGTQGCSRPQGFDGLHRRGMVEFGTHYQIFHWGDSQTYSQIDMAVQVVRLTERGRAECAKLVKSAQQN